MARALFQRGAERLESVTEVTPDLVRVQTGIVNAYFIGPPGAGDRSWVLVDAGMPLSSARIARAAEQRFGTDARPAAIILTHGHFDHVGALPTLADLWDAPIYAHESELPYLTGQTSYPPPDPSVGGGAMAWLSFLYPRGPCDFGDRVEALPDDGTVPGLPEWRWIPTPGHTVGHVSLFRDADRTLIAGDAFVTVRQESALAVLAQKPEVHRPPAYYTPDWDNAWLSVEKLARLDPQIAATGHGVPMRGESLRKGLEQLLDNWATEAIPTQGRYVPETARQSGVPNRPLGVSPPWLALAGLGVAVLLLASLGRRR